MKNVVDIVILSQENKPDPIVNLEDCVIIHELDRPRLSHGSMFYLPARSSEAKTNFLQNICDKIIIANLKK